MEVLDPSGLEPLTAMKDSYIAQGDGFLLVFDVTCETSFLTLREEVSLITRFRDLSEVPLVLVGMVPEGKDDGQSPAPPRQITPEAAMVFSRFLSATYLECPLHSAQAADRVCSQIIARTEEVRDAAAHSRASPPRPAKTKLPSPRSPKVAANFLKKVYHKLLTAS